MNIESGIILYLVVLLMIVLGTFALIATVVFVMWKFVLPTLLQKNRRAAVETIREAHRPVDETPPTISPPLPEEERYGPR